MGSKRKKKNKRVTFLTCLDVNETWPKCKQHLFTWGQPERGAQQDLLEALALLGCSLAGGRRGAQPAPAASPRHAGDVPTVPHCTGEYEATAGPPHTPGKHTHTSRFGSPLDPKPCCLGHCQPCSTPHGTRTTVAGAPCLRCHINHYYYWVLQE